jgi:hypothetical protein
MELYGALLPLFSVHSIANPCGLPGCPTSWVRGEAGRERDFPATSHRFPAGHLEEDWREALLSMQWVLRPDPPPVCPKAILLKAVSQ